MKILKREYRVASNRKGCSPCYVECRTVALGVPVSSWGALGVNSYLHGFSATEFDLISEAEAFANHHATDGVEKLLGVLPK